MIRDAEQVEALQNGTLQMPLETDLILGFNEPDLEPPPGSSLTPAEAVPLERWRLTTYTETEHASPAPSQNDIYWLPRMRDLYIAEYGEPPAWDYLAAHCYFFDDYSLSHCKGVIRQYIKWSQAWGTDGVLVTEFAAAAFKYSPAQEFDYAPAVIVGKQFIDWMKAQPAIKGYFWYSADDWGAWDWYVTTALYDDDELTPLGEMYRNETIRIHRHLDQRTNSRRTSSGARLYEPRRALRDGDRVFLGQAHSRQS